MPEKSVNININYKVNTVEIEKAETLLRKAQTATNSFESTAKQAGASTSTSFKTAGVSLETLNAKLLTLRERIRTSSDPKVVKVLSDQYKSLKSQIDAANKSAFETPKALSQTGQATSSLAGQFGQLYTAVKLAFTAGIIKEVVTTTLEMAKLAGNVEGVSRAFDRALPNEINFLGKLREATRGTITDFELMQRTLQATNFGVAAEQLPVLFEFAAARAQQTGKSMDYLVDSIVRGIGRKSILILDNLDISATQLKEQFNGVSLASQSVADVTRGVAEIAKIELQKMGGYAETSATKVDQLKASWEQLKITLAKKIPTGGFVDFINESVKGLESFIKGNKQLFIEESKKIAASDAARIIESKAFKELGDNQQKKQDYIQQEINSRVQLIGRYNDTVNALKEERKEISDKNPYDKRIESLTKTIRGYNDNKVVIKETIGVLKEYLTEFNKVIEVEEKRLGIIEGLQKQIEETNDAINTSKSLSEIERLNVKLVGLETKLKEIKELGKTPINIRASVIYDIKQNLATGKIKVNTDDLIDTQALEADTTRLFNDLGKKANEEFANGLSSAGNISTEFQRSLEQNKNQLINQSIDLTAGYLTDLVNLEADSYNQRLDALGAFYDNQQYLAGDNQKEKDRLDQEEKKKTEKLRKEQAKKEQQARKFSIIINTAAGIAKAFATSATIYDAYINAAIVAVQGAAQYAIASKAPVGFAKGVLNLDGKGTGTSDSIPANLSRGESVMTAQEWKTSKSVLKEVRAKTLDDKVLSDLKVSNTGVTYKGQLDDSRLLSKLDELKNSIPDVEVRSGIMYTTKKKSDNYRLWVRKSSMSS